MKVLDEKDRCEEKVLPIMFPPPLTSYLPWSIVSAIITACDGTLNWVYNNFIQIYHKSDNVGKVDYFPNSDFAYNDKINLNSVELNQTNYRLNMDTIIDDMKYWIDHKNYVVFYLLESQLPGMRFYKKANVLHSEFVFGYSDEKQCVYVMNFPSGSEKLSVIEVKYDEIKTALESTIKYNRSRFNEKSVSMKNQYKDFRIILLQYNEVLNDAYSKNICIEGIRILLSDYINSRNSSIGTTYFTTYQTGIWGLGVYDQILEDFMISVKKGKKLDNRYMYMIYEHKCIMKERMCILRKCYGVEVLETEMDDIILLTESFKNLVLKYNITYDKKIIERFLPMFEKLKKMESDTYTNYINAISRWEFNQEKQSCGNYNQ